MYEKNAKIIKKNGNVIEYKPVCPKCGHIEETSKIKDCLSNMNIYMNHGQKCSKCGYLYTSDVNTSLISQILGG